MRIIIPGRKVFPTVMFECEQCGCVFEAKRAEYKKFRIRDGGQMISVVETRCPNKDCGAFVQTTVEQE